MLPTQPFFRFVRTDRSAARLFRRAISCARLIGLFLLCAGTALAQGSVPLITIATDQSPLNLSNDFGVPTATAVNQNGDFAFVGNGDTGLFLRTAGASAASRLLQIDDEAPGFPGSKVQEFFPEISLNSSSPRLLLFSVRFTGADNFVHAALLTYDGTNYHTVATSDGVAPGTNGATFGLDLIPGSINDNGDINFSAEPSGTNATSAYIVPSGGAPVPIATLTATPSTPCFNCFLPGVPTTSEILVGIPAIPKLNARGQMLVSLPGGLSIGSKDGTLSAVPFANSGPCSLQTSSSGTNLIPTPGVSAFLNNVGTVVFTNPPTTGTTAICVVTTGATQPTVAVAPGDPAPTTLGGGTLTSPVAQGIDDSGDIVLLSPVSGSNLTTFSLLRYHASTGLSDAVAYNCEAAPGAPSGTVFASSACLSWQPGGVGIISTSGSAFFGVSIANGGSVSFDAFLSNGGSAIYSQAGTALPEFISFGSEAASSEPSGVIEATFLSPIFSSVQTQILNNGSVFFSSFLTGSAADFAVFLGTPGSVQELMSTTDPLPSGARTILGSAPPQAAGHFVAFTAQPAAGRTNLLESDLSLGTITRVASDNDPALAAAGGPPGNAILSSNYFLNENGQVAFETVGTGGISGIGIISFGGSGLTVDQLWLDQASTCGTIYLWSPSSGVTKVAAAGDAAPNQTTNLSCVSLNTAAPSPLNASGEVAFISPSLVPPDLACTLCDPGVATTSVNGDFLFSPPGTVSEIVAANDTLPGQSNATTLVPSLSIPVNSAGQVAFGAELGTSTLGFYLRNGTTVQQVMTMGDPVPGSSDTFGLPHFIAGLSNTGNLAFTAATSAANDGLFLAPSGGGPIQTLALDGGPAPIAGGGTFSLLPPFLQPATGSTGTGTLTNVNFQSFAAINGESDVAFGAGITGGTANSGYFRVLRGSPSAGSVQPVVLQGEAAPGGGTFNTIGISGGFLSTLGANFSLGPDGTLAFSNEFTDTSGHLRLGMFVARPNGTLLKVVATGDPLPGGGVLGGLSTALKLAAGDTGRFAFLAAIEGGSARRGVFVTAIPPGTTGTTITLSQLQSPVVVQQSVTLTATVTGTASGTPTGTVNFFENGISLGTGTLNANGQATLTTSSLATGQDTLVAQYDGDTNFAAGNSASVSVAVVVAAFAPPPANLSVASGKSLVIPLMLFAPSNMSFTLSCSGLPAQASCTFNQNPVAPSPNGTPVQLTLTTVAGSKLLPAGPGESRPTLLGMPLAAVLAAFLAASMLWRRAPRLRLATCACFATVALALALALGGCGSGAASNSSTAPATPGTPPGPASFTVTGTSGETTVSAVVNVTVQ